MHIHVRLHGLFRDYLPAESKGRATLELPATATAGDILTLLSIRRRAVIAVNDTVEVAADHPLHDGDTVAFFGISGGGK